jgi:hypothetical protein
MLFNQFGFSGLYCKISLCKSDGFFFAVAILSNKVTSVSTTDFENSSYRTDEEIEFWLARDLQHLLGYSKWDNFKNVHFKSKKSPPTPILCIKIKEF